MYSVVIKRKLERNIQKLPRNVLVLFAILRDELATEERYNRNGRATEFYLRAPIIAISVFIILHAGVAKRKVS